MDPLELTPETLAAAGPISVELPTLPSTPLQAPTIPTPSPISAPQTKAPSPLKQIRTFQGDIAEALKQSQASVYSIQQAEVQRKQAREVLAPALKHEAPSPAYNAPAPTPTFVPVKSPLPQIETPARVPEEAMQRPMQIGSTESHGWQKTLLLALGTLVLIGAGGAVARYGYTAYVTKSALPTIRTTDNLFVPVVSTLTLDAGTLSRESLIQTIKSEENKLTGKGTEQIQLRLGGGESSQLLSTQSFMTLIGAKPPAVLVRSFAPYFMLGVLGGTPTHTFLLIQLDSFENAFPGMLLWERTLPEDILPLITPGSSVDGAPLQATFEDITIKNKDARILKDVNGKTVLLYSFFNNDMLIITDNEEALRSIITDLTSQALSR